MFSSNTSQVSADANWIEECFSTWLYTGNGSTQTITNGIDLSTKGGLVWFKYRNGPTADYNHFLFDTNRGVQRPLQTNNTSGQRLDTDSLTAFNNNGVTFGANPNINATTSDTYVSWTFREQPKFFDVVTYTGNGTTQNISHSLGSAPGFLVVKCTSTTGNWRVYHRSYPARDGRLNAASAFNTSGTENYWGNNSTTVAPTSTQFTVGNASDVNTNGATYVAYLFAHDAGGFGLTGADNVISCGSFTTDGSGNATVSLGYEPQWVLIKQINGADNWYLNDNMRGMAVSGNQPNLSPNSPDAESAGGYNTHPNATGFTASVGIASATYIYIAIRRGPMKTPTTGTSVFNPVANSNNINASNPVALNPSASDLWLNASLGSAAPYWLPRLANWGYTRSSSTSAENTSYAWTQTTQSNLLPNLIWWGSNPSQINYFFKRAPGFFDVVCYTGNSGTLAVSHNLGVTPELLIIKQRGGSTRDWAALSPLLGGGNYYLTPNNTDASGFGSPAYYSGLTSTTFTLGGQPVTNSSNTYVAYLFASCPGVSKVGSYTGNGTSQTINCGFTGGARFILIKATSTTGGWLVWDSARGIVAGNDPYLALNSTGEENTDTDYVDVASTGFIVNSDWTSVNASGQTYIFLAIA